MYVKAKILVIDDESSIREILQKILKDEGYHVETCDCGLTAFRKILKEDYNLVISDISMPGINGIDLLQKIKEVKPETDVLILTAYNCHTNIQRSFKHKAAGLILKPFDVIELKTKVRRILNFRDHLEDMDESRGTGTYG